MDVIGVFKSCEMFAMISLRLFSYLSRSSNDSFSCDLIESNVRISCPNSSLFFDLIEKSRFPLLIFSDASDSWRTGRKILRDMIYDKNTFVSTNERIKLPKRIGKKVLANFTKDAESSKRIIEPSEPSLDRKS